MAFFGHICRRFLLLGATIWCLLQLCNTESVCRDIQSAKVSISWIGMLTTRFILITSTLDVYDLPTTVLDPTRHRLHLSGSRPLKDIYPVIYKDQKDGTSSFLNTTLKHMTTVDGTSEYLYGETRVGPGYSAHLYDLQSKKLYKYSIKDQAIDKEPILCLSTTDPNSTTFYILTPKNNKLREGAFWGLTIVQTKLLKMLGDVGYLCKAQRSGSKQEIVFTDQCDTDQSDGTISLDVMGGFVDTANFYLFTANRTVIIFSKKAWDWPGTSYAYYIVPYADFFVCQDSKGSLLYFAVGGALLCLLFLALCAIFLCHGGFSCHRVKSTLNPSMRRQHSSAQRHQTLTKRNGSFRRRAASSNRSIKIRPSKSRKHSHRRSVKRQMKGH